MAVMSPEGGVFDLMGGRYATGGVPNFEVYLKAHTGDPLRVSRGTRPDEFVLHPALTIGLTVQPEVMRGLATRREFRGKGLLARFLYALPESRLGYRETDSPPVPEAVRATYAAGVAKLLDLSATVDDRGRSAAHLLRLAPEAVAQWHAFTAWREPKLRPAGPMGTLTDWAAKLSGTVARLAGLLHMAERVDDVMPWSVPISGSTMAHAVDIAKYLIPHARAAFIEIGSDQLVGAALRVMAWIDETDRTEFTERDLYRALRGLFPTARDTKPVLALLLEHAYIRRRPPEPRPIDRGPGGRPPTPHYDVNPLGQNGQNPGEPKPEVDGEAGCGRSVPSDPGAPVAGDTEEWAP
jgi:Protein of unknown function (DUF3987)